MTLDQHPRDLSEGQRLTLALAVVLAARPPLLLLDEPTRGLDYTAKHRLVEILRDLADDGHAVLLATHDVELVAEVADRVLVIADGELVADGPTAEVVVSSPAFAPQVAKVLAPQRWLTPTEVAVALAAHRAGGAVNLVPGPAVRSAVALAAAFAVGIVAFGWPFLTQPGSALDTSHSGDAPLVFVVVLPLLAAVVLAELTAGGMDAKAVAMLGMLAAVGGALRALGPGTAGLEPSFAVIILGGRVFGRGFGFVLGAVTLFAGGLITGGVGPVAAVPDDRRRLGRFFAGCLPPVARPAEVAWLAAYAFVAGLAYGLVMNLWFWPFASYGPETSYMRVSATSPWKSSPAATRARATCASCWARWTTCSWSHARATRSRCPSTPPRCRRCPRVAAHVPAPCRRLQQGDGHPLGQPATCWSRCPSTACRPTRTRRRRPFR